MENRDLQESIRHRWYTFLSDLTRKNALKYDLEGQRTTSFRRIEPKRVRNVYNKSLTESVGQKSTEIRYFPTLSLCQKEIGKDFWWNHCPDRVQNLAWWFRCSQTSPWWFMCQTSPIDRWSLWDLSKIEFYYPSAICHDQVSDSDSQISL